MNEQTPLAEIHRSAGAELALHFGVALPEQFSDPLSEYRATREHAALLDTNFRAIFSLSGPDRGRYLNAVLTSNIRDLAPGQGTIGLLLNPQGHILAELETFTLEDRIVIFSHAFVREKTFATLDKFIIMDDAILADETDASGTLAIEGPDALAILAGLTGADLTGVDLTAHQPYGHVAAMLTTSAGAIPCRVIFRSLFGLPGAELLVAREHLAIAWDAANRAVCAQGGASIGYRAYNMLRLEAGVPWFGADFDERQIPHEAALERSHISYTKGCYTGQEIVERVRSRGHVNRRRTALAFSGTEPPQAGAPLTRAAAEVGHVTSAAFSPRAGKTIGMGYVKRENTQIGAQLQCGDFEAQVIELPLP